MTNKEYKLDSCLTVQHGGNHYKDRGIQPIEFAQANNLDWKQFNVVKYVTRHKDKKGAEDLKKAIHYLQMALEFDYGVRSAVEFDDGEVEAIHAQVCINLDGPVVIQGSSIKYVEEDKETPWYPDDSGDWVEHTGHSLPIHGDSLVEVLMKSERDDMDYGCCIEEAGEYRWCHTGCESDIVAYKIVKG